MKSRYRQGTGDGKQDVFHGHVLLVNCRPAIVDWKAKLPDQFLVDYVRVYDLVEKQ